MHLRTLLLSSLIFLTSLSWADEARSLYDAGKYEEALQSLKAKPADTSSYYFDLGTTYYRLAQYGNAVSYLEKAKRLKAHDSDIQHNLELAKSNLSKILGADRLDPASTWLESVADNAPLEEIRGTLGLLAFVVTLFWIRAYSRSRSLRKTFLEPSGALGLIALAITAGLYFAERIAADSPPAMTIEKQVVRSGPGEQFLELSSVEPGMKLRLLGPKQDTWRQIRYGSEGIGWVKESSLLLL